MADIQKALNWMEKGKQVARKSWRTGLYYYTKAGSAVYNEIDERVTMNFSDVRANDWFVYDEDPIVKALRECDFNEKDGVEQWWECGSNNISKNMLKD
jgi:hypothetical protein